MKKVAIFWMVWVVSSVAISGCGRSLKTDWIGYQGNPAPPSLPADPSVPVALSNTSLATQADGKVLVGGRFTSIRGESRAYLARLNADGSYDSTFLDTMTGPNGEVRAVAFLPDGKILVGGQFTQINGEPHAYVARLNSDGSVDSSFKGAAPSWVNFIVAKSSGKVMVGGWGPFVLQLNSDGSPDSQFSTIINLNTVGLLATGITWQPDLKFVMSGQFISSYQRSHLLRFSSNGVFDSGFAKTSEGEYRVLSVLATRDGSLITSSLITDGATGESKVSIQRLNGNGSIDSTFSKSAVSGDFTNKYVLHVQADSKGRIYLGGFFDSVNGVPKHGIARLNRDGTLDGSFLNGLPGADGAIRSLFLESDGKILVSGPFTQINGVSRDVVARLNEDGSLDDTFE